MELTGQNILVTGASNGIGKAIAIKLIELGATVTITGRDQVASDALQERKGDVLGEYPQATGEQAQGLFEIATTISDETRTWMREYLETNFNTRF